MNLTPTFVHLNPSRKTFDSPKDLLKSFVKDVFEFFSSFFSTSASLQMLVLYLKKKKEKFPQYTKFFIRISILWEGKL